MNHPTPDHDQPTPERVERMRRGVFSAVDADVTRRGRRTRRALAGAAAACVVVVGGVGFAGILAPSGGNEGTSASSAADVATVPPDSIEDGAGDSSENPLASSIDDLGGDDPERAAGSLVDEVAPDSYGGTDVEPVDPDRDVVTTGSVSVDVDDPAAAADRLAAWLGGVGGRVDSRTESDESDESGPAFASLTVRVPADQVDATVEELRGYGTVTTIDVSREDVTTQRVDLDARIDSLRISVERLQDILADADSARDLLAVESTLSERQADLSSLEAQRKALGEQVALSTLTVSLGATDRAGSPDPGGFGGGLKDGWNALVATVDAVVVALGVALPWLGVVAVLTVAWFVVRRVRRRRAP